MANPQGINQYSKSGVKRGKRKSTKPAHYDLKNASLPKAPPSRKATDNYWASVAKNPKW